MTFWYAYGVVLPSMKSKLPYIFTAIAAVSAALLVTFIQPIGKEFSVKYATAVGWFDDPVGTVDKAYTVLTSPYSILFVGMVLGATLYYWVDKLFLAKKSKPLEEIAQLEPLLLTDEITTFRYGIMDVSIHVENPGERTITGVTARISSIEQLEKQEVDGAIIERLLDAPLRLKGPRNAFAPTPWSTDLHPKQSARFELARVFGEKGNVIFHAVKEQARDNHDGNQVYISYINKNFKNSGHYFISVIVQGTDLQPETLVFEINTLNNKLEVTRA